MSNFHTENIASILNKFDSNIDEGLSVEALEKAKSRYGKNEFGPPESSFRFGAFFKVLVTWRTVVLIIAAVMLGVLFVTDTSPISVKTLGVVVVALGVHIVYVCIAEYQVRCGEVRVNELVAHRVKVFRQGRLESCLPEDVVPGDLLSLDPGDYIPADARVLSAEGLLVDESILFGTDDPVRKISVDISDAALPPQDQKNMVFGGTYIIAGHGSAIVVRTGRRVEIWKQRQGSRPMPVPNTCAEAETKDLYTVLKMVGLGVAALAVGVGWWFEYQNQTTDWSALVLLGVVFVVAAAPYDVVGLLRFSFAKHAQRLIEKGVTLRNSRGIEKLGGITTFCAKEDGIATTRALSVANLFVGDQLVDGNTWRTWVDSLQALPVEKRQEVVATIPSDGRIPQDAAHLILIAGLGTSGTQNVLHTPIPGSAVFSETADDETVASLRAAIRTNMEKLGYGLESVKANFRLVDVYPSTRHYGYQLQVFESAPGEYLNIIFGDARAVLDTCGSVLISGENVPLLEDRYVRYREIIDNLLSTKAQVHGVAFHSSDVIRKPQELESTPTFLGFMSFSVNNDEETKAVLKSSQDTGLKIILISEGKEQETVDLAKDLGIIHNRKSVATRKDFERVPREEIDEETSRWLAYSRPTGEQRRHIVLSLKRQGHAVGFLGQNRLDLRAMAASDIALATGSHASHVVQASADGLIVKKGFKAVRDALLHAREAYHNVAGFLRWHFSCTLSLLLTLTFGTVLHYLYKMPMPLTLTQIIWTQLLLTLLPCLAIGTERIFGDAKHHRPPLFSRGRFLSRTTGLDIICRSVTISLMGLIPFVFILWDLPALSDSVGVSTFLRDVFSVGSPGDPNSANIVVARTVVCTTLIFTQLATCWQTLRYPWESLFPRMLANPRLIFISVGVIALHLTVLYVAPVVEFLQMSPLKWEWHWVFLFSLILFLLPLNLAINSHDDAA